MKIALGFLALSFAIGCTHDGGKVLGDTQMYDKDKKAWVPVVEHRAPDIDELTGIDSTEPEPTEPTEPPPAPAAVTPPPAATPTPVATPVATPAKTPPAAATPAKTPTPPVATPAKTPTPAPTPAKK